MDYRGKVVVITGASSGIGRDAAVVTATWLFRRASTPERIQRGPLTAVLVQRPAGWRIAHMAFGNWPAA